MRFTNTEQEQPIGELSVYYVDAGAEPKGTESLAFHLGFDAGEDRFITGRFPADEGASLIARPAGTSLAIPSNAMPVGRFLPLVHVLIPLAGVDLTDGLDGIALDLPALKLSPLADGLIALNIQVRDPLWPARNLLNFTFSVKPNEAKTLWLDTRDRILPKDKPLYLTIACASPEFDANTLFDAKLRLVFKSREAARPEHELDRFTQVRDAYAMLVEEHPTSLKLALWARFKGDLEDLLRVSPEHELGRKYAAAGLPGSPRPPFTQPVAPPGVPLWAFRQTELLGRVKKFVLWYIDHRQSAYGDFGGGISDDVDLTNTWPGVALMGSEPEKIKRSLQRLLDAAYKNGMFTRGLPTIQADELHSYEEGINCLAQNLILDYGSPRQLERAMENIRGVESITGINAAGHRHIRSSYYSGTKMAEEGPWGWSKPYSYLVLHPAYLFADYNGSPAATKLVTELADGLLAHYRPGSGRNGLPAAIHYATDAEGEATRGMLPWPLFWSAWRSTGDKKFLAPITDSGLSGLSAVNANVLDLLALRPEWRKSLVAGERAESLETRRPDGRTRSADAGFRASAMFHFTWQLDGDKRGLEALYASQIEQCAHLEFINTEGSLWI
ncbi:MAG: hypothetical protein NTV51_01470, partial [Verrucomicrobia bacterium]|nr:hypothetical protein [Verrucomicrobiota bacterium]